MLCSRPVQKLNSKEDKLSDRFDLIQSYCLSLSHASSDVTNPVKICTRTDNELAKITYSKKQVLYVPLNADTRWDLEIYRIACKE